MNVSYTSQTIYLPGLLLMSLLLLSACTAGRQEASESPSGQAPNILFLFSDDQRADAVGAYGNPYIETPHLDRLTETGFNFREAHIMGSHHGAVCAPSRAMLLSGRHLFRVYDDLDTVRTFPQQLRAAGYVTFGTGKWHQSRSSFQKSFSHGKNIFFGGMSDHFEVPVRNMRDDGSFTEAREKGFSSTLFADAAVNFIEEYAASDTTAPFLSYVSFTAPHDPRTPPEPYLKQYPAESMPLPSNYQPVHSFNLGNGTMTIRDEQLAPWPRTPEVVRAQLGEYYGIITHMDAQIGRILEALHQNGLRENTIIVFASDNGLAIGSHGLLGKQNMYEHSTRVPLVVTGPGIPQGESRALVYLHDLAPTIAGLAGAEGPEGMDGKNLAPIWKGEQEHVRDMLLTAYEGAQRSVRTDRWKLIYYPKLRYTQLFDLQQDPHELKNLASDTAYRDQQTAMMDSLRTWHARLDDPYPLSPDEQTPMEFDHSQVERAPDRHQPESIRKKYFQE